MGDGSITPGVGYDPVTWATDPVVNDLYINHSDIFGGAFISGGKSHIMLTRRDPAVEAEISSKVDSAMVDISVSPRTWTAVIQAEHKIAADYKKLAAAGIVLGLMYPNAVSGTLTIGVRSQSLKAAQDLLPAQYPDVPLSIVADNSLPGQLLANTSRTNDASPYNGGDFIVNFGGPALANLGLTVVGGHLPA